MFSLPGVKYKSDSHSSILNTLLLLLVFPQSYSVPKCALCEAWASNILNFNPAVKLWSSEESFETESDTDFLVLSPIVLVYLKIQNGKVKFPVMELIGDLD